MEASNLADTWLAAGKMSSPAEERVALQCCRPCCKTVTSAARIIDLAVNSVNHSEDVEHAATHITTLPLDGPFSTYQRIILHCCPIMLQHSKLQ